MSYRFANYWVFGKGLLSCVYVDLAVTSILICIFVGNLRSVGKRDRVELAPALLGVVRVVSKTVLQVTDCSGGKAEWSKLNGRNATVDRRRRIRLGAPKNCGQSRKRIVRRCCDAPVDERVQTRSVGSRSRDDVYRCRGRKLIGITQLYVTSH